MAWLVYCTLIAARMQGEKSVIDGTVFTFSATFRKLAYNYLCIYALFYWLFVLGQHSWHQPPGQLNDDSHVDRG